MAEKKAPKRRPMVRTAKDNHKPNKLEEFINKIIEKKKKKNG